jgi:hypothetical protein
MNFTALLRCTNKNLSQSGTTADSVTSSLSVVPDSSQTQPVTGSVTLSYPLSSDQIQLGSYYQMNLIDGTPPTR